MRLPGGIAAPAIVRIIEWHRRLELGKILFVHARISQRCSQQARTFRDKVRPRRISAAHDLGEVKEGLRLTIELLDHGIERAGLIAMAPEHTLDVKRGGVEALGDIRDLGSDDKEKYCVRINEAADEPRGGDAVDFGPAPCEPQRPTLRIAWWNLVRPEQSLAGLFPAFKSAFENFRANILVP